MSINKDSVKHYHTIRRYLSLIYLYGFFSREDFREVLPESSDSYDECIRLIKELYPEMHEGSFADKRKYLSVSRTAQPGDLDRLSATFFLHDLAEKELFNVLRLMEESAYGWMGKTALIETFCVDQSKATVRRRLDELIDLGYLEKCADSTIRPRKNPLADLSGEELGQLYSYVRFCGNVTYPRAPARILLHALEREYLCRGETPPARQLVQFLHNPNHNVMEEDLVYTLLRAIREKREVLMKLGRGKDRKTHPILPLRLRIDRRLGRWYLLSMEDRPTVRRLSRIRSLELGEPVDPERWEALRQQVEDAFRYSRFSGLVPEDGPKTVRVKLRFGEIVGLRRQFLRELSGGEVRKEGEDEIFTEKINDPGELIPVLRSYSPWLEPVDKDDPTALRIREDLRTFRAQLTEEAEP